MKGINLQCVYDVDDEKYPFVAFNQQGQLFGFVNPPVRDYKNLEWIDSATGDPGDLIPYSGWDSSARETKECYDIHSNGSRTPRASVPMSPEGKRYIKFKRKELKNGRTQSDVLL